MQKLKIIVLLLLTAVQAYAGYPRRIVSLAPSLTKNLYLLGAGDRLKGCTSFCMPDAQDSVVVVASAVQVNIEKAAMLKPDLVIATPLTSPEVMRTFEKLGIEVISFSYPLSFNDICSQLLVLAEKTGTVKRGRELVAEANSRLEVVKGKVPSVDKKPRLFIQIGANPLFTVVPNTFMNDFIEFAGGENIAGDLKIGSITREAVLVRNPDVILVVLMGLAGDEEKKQWETYRYLSAVRDKRIFIMDQEKMCSPTPQQFVEALDEIIELIY